MKQDSDKRNCAEWLFSQVSSAARTRSRVWFRDPDRLLSLPVDQIEKKLGSDKAVLLVKHSLALRQLLNKGAPNKWVLIDQTPAGSASLPVFAPDLRRLVDDSDIFNKTVRDFLVDQTQEQGWPLDVESFPYRELARDNPTDFIRAYDDFRAGREAGFTTQDLILIAAGAVLNINLFALLEPFQVLELAFHSDDKWERIKDYFGENEIAQVRDYLSKLRPPLGDLFGSRPQSARLAAVGLLVLSRHFDNPAPYLPNLTASLSGWQDCEALYAGTMPPAWFQDEIDRFDDSVTDGFLSVMRTALNLAEPQKADEFIRAKCWSRKLRELALPYDTGERQVPGKVSEGKATNLEAMVPHFRGLLAEIENIVHNCRAECDRIRCTHPAQLKMSRFVALFRDLGSNRLPLLVAEMRNLGGLIGIAQNHPPGFADYWQKCRSKGDVAADEAENILKDVDFLLGRFLESQYASAIPGQMPVINQLLEKLIVPTRGESPDKPVAIILLDGMRYDLWSAIIRPHLERRFQCEEQVGMSLLPSETKISRFGFFSGMKPAEFFGIHYPGGEIAACQALLKRLSPGHPDLDEWDAVSAHASFSFRTKDSKLFGVVLDFADAIGHVSAWEIDFLAELVQVWLKKLDQVLNTLPKDCTIWITTDHGQVISGTNPIDIPSDWLLDTGNGYRSALVKDRLLGPHSNHVFYLRARDLGYDSDGYWAFPKPGYSFRLQDKDPGRRTRFKPIDNMRHSGLSAFEVFIPVVRLMTRSEQIRVSIKVKPPGPFTVGVLAQIAVEISASTALQGQVELTGNVDGLSPVLVQDLNATPQTVYIPFVPAKVGLHSIQLAARWGFKALPDPVTISVQVQADKKRTEDSLDSKLKKLFGN